MNTAISFQACASGTEMVTIPSAIPSIWIRPILQCLVVIFKDLHAERGGTVMFDSMIKGNF
ncbi:MAG: hypothetical protein ABGX07_02700 [Pirellulaceae bacterium]